MCIGLAWFVLAESTLDMNFDATGVAMLSLALAADAALGNVQEKAMKQYHAANAEVICYSYTLGFVYLALAMASSGTLLPSAAYFAVMPTQKYGSAFVFSLSGYFGMQVVLSLVRRFGAFTTVTVTSFRKALTIVVSFLAFSKPFSIQYVFSGLLVLVGIYLNLLSKRHRSFNWKRLAAVLVYLMKTLVNKKQEKNLSTCKTAVC
jgi:adenosine 3'-phospho 5'-phosphosulfate transporter B3